MAKYNLYRIVPEKRFELMEKLRAEGLGSAKKIEVGDCALEFMFSYEPKGTNIGWVKTYREFLDGIETAKNITYCGAFFIYNDDFCYAVALGKSYLQIKDYCDADFGINMAERIAADRVKIKNSKFYKSRRNRVAATYPAGNRLEFDSGESLDMIRATTVDPLVWGATANFGIAVQFSLDIAPEQLPAFIKKIEEVLKQPPKMNLPKVMLIRDVAREQDLEAMLAQKLTAQDDSGITFIANDDCRYSFYLQGEYGNLSAPGELDKKSWQNFLATANINLREQLNDIKVRIYNSQGREKSKNFKAMVDFFDEEKGICLIDGKWYRYNHSFLNFLRQEAATIVVEKDNSQAEDNLESFIAARTTQGYLDCRKIIAAIDQKFKVNKLELFKNNTLYFIKYGAPEAINYAADQAINAVKYLQGRGGRIELNGQIEEVERIGLWLVPPPHYEIGKIEQINSLNFLMKIADWRRAVLAAGFRPRLRISQTHKNLI